jgi:hypothetical protein
MPDESRRSRLHPLHPVLLPALLRSWSWHLGVHLSQPHHPLVSRHSRVCSWSVRPAPLYPELGIAQRVREGAEGSLRQGIIINPVSLLTSVSKNQLLLLASVPLRLRMSQAVGGKRCVWQRIAEWKRSDTIVRYVATCSENVFSR